MTKKLYYFNNACEKEYYQKLASRPFPKGKFSKYRGVQRNRNPKKPYRASFKYAGRSYYIGSYATELEAARAYNEAAKKIIGDHALLNVLDDDLKKLKQQKEV
jgi:hypothetical protein